MEKELSFHVPRERAEKETAHVTDELLSAYLEGNLAADEQTRAETHLSGCSSCQGELALMKKMVELLRTMPLQEVSPDSLERLHRCIDEYVRRRSGRKDKKEN